MNKTRERVMHVTSRDRFRAMYEHREADRVPILDSPWNETIDRWVAEGMPTRDYIAYFDLDDTAYISTDNSPRYAEKILLEDDESVIRTTKWGAKTRTFKKRTTTPEHLGFRVTTREEWEKTKERMRFGMDRIDWAVLRRDYAKWKKEGRWITGGLWFGFDITHSYMTGTENLLFAMFDDPEWVKDMFETELELSLQLLQKVWDAGYTFDEVHWYDDMGYKGTQFFSREMYRELLLPYHRRAIEWAHAHSCPARLHSCGYIEPFIGDLVDAGLDGLNPLEVKAGMDPVKLKHEYGDRLVFHGGINAVNWDKKDVIIDEIRRVVPEMKRNGGYIFASDHSIPPHVSFEDARMIFDEVKKTGSY